MDKIYTYLFIAVSSFVLFLTSNTAVGQNVSSYSFNDLYDFDVKTIYDIKQDDYGTFWFGTNRGLVKFDGKNFETFFYPKFDKEYTNIKFGSDKSVYFTNFGGQLFRLNNDSIEIVIEYVLEDSFIKDYHFVGRDIYYFVSGGKKIYKHRSSKKIEEVIVKFSGSGIFQKILLKDDILIAYRMTNNLKGAKEKISRISKYEIGLSLRNNIRETNLIEFPQESAINQVINSSKKELFFQFATDLKVYDLTDQTNRDVVNIEINSTTINGLYQQSNNVYILGKTQVHEFNLSTKKDRLWMDNVNCSAFFVDNEGNTWVGTLNEGIKIVPSNKVIQFDLSDFTIGVSSISNDKTIYFSDSRGNFYKTSPPYLTSEKFETVVPPRQRISINDYSGKVYVASHSEYYDSKKRKLVRTKSNDYFKYRFFLNKYDYIRTGGDYAYLFGDIKNLPFRFPELLHNEMKNSLDTYVLKGGRSNQVFVDDYKNYMYLDFIDGLIVFSRDQDPVSPYLKGEPILVSAMHSDGDNGMYIASNNNELIYFKDGTYQTHIELSEQIDKICLAKEFIFLKGNKGIHRYNFKSKKIDLINFTNGVETDDIVDMYFHSDTLYVIGGKGVTKFPYSFGEKNSFAPYISLNAIELFDKPVSSNKTVFNHDENQITFKFQAIGIRSQKTLTYQYQLNNQDWQQTSWSVPFVRYAKLAPGEYEFKVKACNEDGVCSDELSYQFEIKKHFSETWWFTALVILAGLVIILLIIYFRLARIKKENNLLHKQEELKREVYKSKITAIRSQMNPHFMFNALNTIQDYIISNEKLIASEFLADFADLMRLYLNQSKQDFITIDEEVRTIELYLKLEKSRFGSDFLYDIKVDENVDAGNVEIPIMLLQPLIENAIKHGLLHKEGKKQLTISIGFENNRLKLEVNDNGIGFENSMKMKAQNSAHESFATNAMQEKITLLKLHYQIDIDFQVIHLKDENEKSIGTKIELYI